MSLILSLICSRYKSTLTENSRVHDKMRTLGQRGGWCGPHRAALARGDKRTKIVFKNSRENSGCNFMCLRAIKTKHITAAARTYPQYPGL